MHFLCFLIIISFNQKFRRSTFYFTFRHKTYGISSEWRNKILRKLLKLFIIGFVLTITSFIILYVGIMSNSKDVIIVVIPGAVGVFLMLLSSSIGMKKWVRGLERD